MIRRDWLLQMIEQLADFVRKISGLADKGKHQEALDVASRAWSELLDVPRDVVERVDGPTLAELLREPAKMRAAANLLIAEARAYSGKGDPLHATLCYRRAYELYLEARSQAPAPDDDGTILELSRHVPPGEVHERYRSRL